MLLTSRPAKSLVAAIERDERPGLSWEDIDWDEKIIEVDGKTGPRPVPVIDDESVVF